MRAFFTTERVFQKRHDWQSTIGCWVWFASAMMFLPARAAADEALVAPQELRQVQLVLTRMEQERQKLVTGEFRARVFEHQPADRPEEQRTAEIYSAFDTIIGKLRFDVKRQVEVIELANPQRRITAEDLKAAPRRVVQYEQRFVQAPTETFHWATSSPREARKGAAGARGPSEAFHGNSLGLISGLGQVLPLDEILATFRKEKLVKFEETGEVLRVTWIYGPDDSRKRTLWIDQARGCTPIRIETHYRLNPDDAWGEPLRIATCEWSEKDGVWLPHLVLFSERLGGRVQPSSRLEIEWMSVNSPVEASTFTSIGLRLGLSG